MNIKRWITKNPTTRKYYTLFVRVSDGIIDLLQEDATRAALVDLFASFHRAAVLLAKMADRDVNPLLKDMQTKVVTMLKDTLQHLLHQAGVGPAAQMAEAPLGGRGLGLWQGPLQLSVVGAIQWAQEHWVRLHSAVLLIGDAPFPAPWTWGETERSMEAELKAKYEREGVRAETEEEKT